MAPMNSDHVKKLRVGLRQTRVCVGRNLRLARVAKRMTIKELARSVDISQERLDNVEMGKGEVKLFELHRLTVMLDIRLRDFFK